MIYNLLTWFPKLVPLYFVVILGFIAGRKLGVKAQPIGTLLIYIVSPIVAFSTLFQLSLSPGRVLLPFFYFLFCSFLGVLTYRYFSRGISLEKRGILAFASGSGNSGYFGFPVVVALLGEQTGGLVMLCALGFTLYENSLGFFLAARGNYSVKESILKVLRLPTFYAMVLALFFNSWGYRLGPVLVEWGKHFQGTYTVLGMLLLGIGAGQMASLKWNARFFLTSFSIKFLLWPLLTLLVFYIDSQAYSLFDPTTRQVMFLMSLVPLPAISVAVAALFNAHPEEVALTVLASTIWAMFWIPFGWSLFAN